MDLCIPLSMFSLLPEEVLIDIIARVPRCYYPTISLVSKHLRSLVASPELYVSRSLSGCTEHCIYLMLYCFDTRDYHWYTLVRKANISRLVLIPSLSPMSPHKRFVSMGSSIYMVCENLYVLPIDCRSHTFKPIFSIPMTDLPVPNTVACVMDKKLYLIGFRERHGYGMKKEDWLKVMVFDTETQMWELETTKLCMEGHFVPYSCVLIGDKIYMSGSYGTLVYEPKERKLEIEKMLDSKKWWKNLCVIDDVLYYFDHDRGKLRAYDTKHKRWRVVRGLKESLPKKGSSWWPQTVIYGGKMAVFFPKSEGRHQSEKLDEKMEIWCVEIALERHKDGEIWGKTQWRDVVLKGGFEITRTLAITV